MLNKLIMDKQDEDPEAPEDYSDKVNSKEVRLVKDLSQQVVFQSKLGRTTRFHIQAFSTTSFLRKRVAGSGGLRGWRRIVSHI